MSHKRKSCVFLQLLSMTAWGTSTLIHTTAKVNFLPLAHTWTLPCLPIIAIHKHWISAQQSRSVGVLYQCSSHVTQVLKKVMCLLIYGTCHKKLYEIRGNSAKLLCSYPRNCSTTSAESVSHFRGMILRCPRNDAVRGFVLTKLGLPASWNVALVASNNNGLITDT